MSQNFFKENPMSFNRMHNDYLDPDRAGLNDEHSGMTVLNEFQHGDGAHCGLTDWYPEKEVALASALASGKPFDTGWYASKKEIATARIFSVDGKIVHVEVSVSDDFDTPGSGEANAAEPTLESIKAAIMEAWEQAESYQKDNREYIGYALFKWTTEIPFYARRDANDKRKRYLRKRKVCMDYLILPLGDLDSPPPGDYYHFWGWQNDYRDETNEPLAGGPAYAVHLMFPGNDDESGTRCVEKGIPARTVKAFEAFAIAQNPGSLRIGDWEIAAWSDD